ncbi:ribonuclease Z [Fadolivirus algeromassiliense]|jgi:ribonuclease Z|uniref:Ribonuclease Z n=1 Tax=Fadolivirus FV1/VV64 TaxID=3070911 RepID=A0A7D3QUV1_9VIRU|nr:ribonuclease Z [Fadolivirus algeromassiliense]QKF94465.1 ribonuclease Z [Fadolivirus FV1/VV64]
MSLNSEQNALWKVWEDRDPITLPDTTYTLRGFSIAALRTNFYIKELGIMLDGGLSASYSPDYIFITHSHTDHVASLPFHLYSAKLDTKMQIYVPEESLDNIDKMINSVININADVPGIDEYDPLYCLIPVRDGVINQIIRGKKFKIEIIKCYHGVPCVGYGFIEMRNKLKEEYRDLPPNEIGKLRKSGIDVTHEVEYPIFCFLGDTSKEILNDSRIQKYRTIMIECTFINKEDIEQADKTMHMHWDYLKDYVESHPDNTFILYHFSRRNKKSDIEQFFENMNIPNVIPWIN